MDKCLCGTKRFYEYRGNDNILLGVICRSCDQEWLRETRNPTERIIFQGQKMGKYTHKKCLESGLLMTRPERTKITQRNVRSLRKGDHITWHRTYVLWHHAIVVKTFSSGLIEICHFDSDNERNENKAIIKTKEINPLNENGFLYKINYSNIPEENSAELVVARTRYLHSLSTNGKYRYKVFTNNCENFATFCRTGFSISYQFEWLSSRVKQTIGNTLITMFRVKNLFLLGLPRHIHNEELIRISVAVCSSVLVRGEVKTCYKDIGRINTEIGLSDEDRSLEKFKRITECVGGVITVSFGSYATGYLILDFAIVIGGPWGLFAGKFVGALVGDLISTSGLLNKGLCTRAVLMYSWNVVCVHSFF